MNRILPEFFTADGELVETYNNPQAVGLRIEEIDWVKRNYHFVEKVPVIVGINNDKASDKSLVLVKRPELSSTDDGEPLIDQKTACVES